QYTRRVRIAQSSALPPIADEPASSVRDVNKGEACPTDSGFIADQDMATIAKSSTLSHDTAPRVTSLAAVEGSMQQSINELTALCTNLQRQHSELLVQFQAQKVEINKLNARVKILKDNKGVIGARSADDAPIKGRRIDEEEEKRSYGRVRHSKKQRLQEHIDAQVARELEEQQERKDKRMTKQIAKDAEVAMIHAEEELHGMIDSLDRTNETIAKIIIQRSTSFRVNREDHGPKKQKKDYYMTVIRKNLGWKVKDFKGMTFEEIEAKFAAVWKLVEDFIPMVSKEEAERLKRKGFNLEQEKAKKHKTSEEVPDKEKSPEEILEEKAKEMMQLVPIEEVYVQALQVKHPIIDWKVHIEGQRSYWNIIRQRDLHASREGLSSEEGSSPCNDLLQASSGKFFTNGK
nr:hypothetical protein [Tanacetum cinerariifolium]